MRKFHVRFKTQITSRRRLEHETKVYNTNYKQIMGYQDDKMIKNQLIATMTMTATTTRTSQKATGLNKYINNNNKFARASRFFLEL